MDGELIGLIVFLALLVALDAGALLKGADSRHRDKHPNWY